MRLIGYKVAAALTLTDGAAYRGLAPVRADVGSVQSFGVTMPLGYLDWRLISVAHVKLHNGADCHHNRSRVGAHHVTYRALIDQSDDVSDGRPEILHLGANFQDHIMVSSCIWEYPQPIAPHGNGGEATIFARSGSELDSPDIQLLQIQVLAKAGLERFR